VPGLGVLLCALSRAAAAMNGFWPAKVAPLSFVDNNQHALPRAKNNAFVLKLVGTGKCDVGGV
jgi:hypothetical protein